MLASYPSLLSPLHGGYLWTQQETIHSVLARAERINRLDTRTLGLATPGPQLRGLGVLGKTALLIIPTHTGGEDPSSCSAGKATLPPSPHSTLESGYMFHGLHGLFITAVGTPD